MIEEKHICPLCKNKLYHFYEGYVCKNYKCDLYYKKRKGWVKKGSLFPTEKRFNKLDLISASKLNSWDRINYLNWLLLKREVMYRDNYECQSCGSIEFLQVHHIIPRDFAPELAFDMDNCITLCRRCHLKKIHYKEGD